MSAEIAKTEQHELIESKILSIRGLQVMLDSDVADFFGMEVKRVNEQMKRNKDRFPPDFCFKLTDEEYKKYLRSHFATFGSLSSKRRYNPYVYTEQGIIALAGVIKNDFAVKMSITIVRAFFARICNSMLKITKTLLNSRVIFILFV